MPLPKPHSGESQDDFISRCMSDETAMDDFPDQEQRLAVCFRQWREERGMTGMERKQLRVEIKDAEKGIVRAAFARMEVKDHDGDWTLPGAFGEQKVRVSAYGHASWMGELPVGKGTITEQEGEAVAELRFFMNTASGREHFETVKEMGDLQEWSYGFDVLETGEITEELDQMGVRRVLKKLKVHEVSPVLLGAGVGTRTLAVKALEQLLDKIENPNLTGLKEPDEEVVTDSTSTTGNADGVTVEIDATDQKADDEFQAAVDEEVERFTRNMRKTGRDWLLST